MGPVPQVPLGVCTKVQKSSAVVIAPCVTGLAQTFLALALSFLFTAQSINQSIRLCSGPCLTPQSARAVAWAGGQQKEQHQQQLERRAGTGVLREKEVTNLQEAGLSVSPACTAVLHQYRLGLPSAGYQP